MSRAHPGADRDHRVRGLEGGALGPGRQPVATAELLGLPRPVGFERVGGHHVRDVLQHRAEHAAQIRVPGVGVHQVDRRHRRRHRQVGPEHPQGGVRPVRIVLRVRGRALAWLTHALHVDVDQLAQLRHELGHVHPGAAVDRGWVLPGEEGDTEPVTVGWLCSASLHSGPDEQGIGSPVAGASGSRTGVNTRRRAGDP